MKKISLSLFAQAGLLLTLLVFSSKAAYADTVCNPTYGGGQQCLTTQWNINKMVLNPATNSFVDNLTLSDTKFRPGDTVQFRIQITNTGSASLGIITVTDTLPDFIDLDTVSGPAGVDKANRTVVYTVNSLAPGEMKEQFLSAKVLATAALPANQNTFCPVNNVSARADNVPSVSDSSQFCVQKVVTGVTTTPPTGSSEWILLGLGTSAVAGIMLRKKIFV